MITKDLDSSAIDGPLGRMPSHGSLRTGPPKAEGMCLSYWLQGVRNHYLLDHRTTEALPETADVVIIGSGITGTLSALKLLESAHPPKSVVILEAREFCSGATGRNAGHCRPDQYRGFQKFARLHGNEQAIKILDNERDTWEKLVAYVQEEKVDCDLWIGKSFDCPMTDSIAAECAATFEAFKAAGGKTDHIQRVTDPAEAAKVSRLRSAKAVYAWDASTLYPWKLVAHLAVKALNLGVNLQTWTPVSAVTGSNGRWTVTTSRGKIATSTVLFATNAYTGALLAETEGAIRPIPHMCNKVLPPTVACGSKALQNTYSVGYPGGFFSVNPRSSSDGIMLVGGSNPNYSKFHDYVAEDPTRLYDDSLVDFDHVTDAVKTLTQVEFGWDQQKGSGVKARYDYAWSGIIGRSADEVPFVGAVPGKKGLWICAGHNGHGMARIFTAAPGVVKLIQGGKWRDTGLPECFEITQERLDSLKTLEISMYPGKS